MPRYGIFLRGMNLGRRRLSNDELIACFNQLGYHDASAFLASGNVVVTTKERATTLQARLQEGLEKLLTYPVPTFVREEAELRTIATRDPFRDRGAQKSGKLQVALLATAPDERARLEALARDTADDWLTLQGRELYWWPKHGVGRTELDLRFLEKALGPMTIRTHGTIERLVAKLFT